jgi:glutamine amidotransferase
VSPPGIGIVPTGTANLAAVTAAFERLGCSAAAVEGPDDIERHARIVLPGVGSFESGISALRDRGWAEPLRRRIREDRPTLAICLGLQLLCESSEEAPGVAGLGVIRGRVERFPDSVRVPHLGWNAVRGESPSALVESGAAYYANSYRLPLTEAGTDVESPDGWSRAWTDHGGRFVAALERGGVLACQFHPELSGAWGRALLARWLDRIGCGPQLEASGSASTRC